MKKTESIKAMFQEFIPNGESVIQGTVINVSPLVIQAINDPKLILPETILIVPFHLRDYQTQVDMEWQGKYGVATIDSRTHKDGTHDGHINGEGSHINHLETFNIFGATITIYNALKVGEKVHLLSFNHDKKYYVLDRVGSERKVS